MNTAAIIVALVTGLVTILLAAKNKVGLTIIGSIITSIALFVAFPGLLTSKVINIGGQTGLIIAGLIGVIIALLAVASKKVHTMFVLVGVIVATWAAFRLLPTLPPAFEGAGQDSQKVWDDLVGLFTHFFHRAFASK